MSVDNDHSPCEEVNNNQNDQFKYLKDLDTSKLQALLQQESFWSNNDQLDIDLIQHIVAILDEREPIDFEPDAAASLKSFKEEIAPYLKPEEKETSNVPLAAPVLVPIKRKRLKLRIASAFIAAVVTALLGSTLVASALGYNIWEYVVNWGKETFQIGSGAQITPEPDAIDSDHGEASNINSSEFQTIDDAVAALNKSIAVPNWVPSGYKFDSADIFGSSQLKSLTAVYKSAESVVLFSAAIFNTEDAAYSYEINEGSGESIVIQGNTCYIMTNTDQNRIVWIKGNTVYSINGDINKDDLIKMVSSIYEGD